MKLMDLYATHLEFVNNILQNKRIDSCVEFGMGNFSTPLFLENVKNVFSIEMQSINWFNEIVEKFKKYEDWKYIFSPGALAFLELEYPDKIDLAFVDGHGDSRPECVNFMMEKGVPIIIAHDTEESGYGWERVFDDERYEKEILDKYKNWTTVWTKVI